MPKPLKYAEACKKAYLPGKEAEYIRRMLDTVHDNAIKHPYGEDKDVVMRATKAMVWLHAEYKDGVPGKRILTEAKFRAYSNANSHGLWPWLEEYGGLPVIKKLQGGKYMVAEEFYPALSRYFSGYDGLTS